MATVCSDAALIEGLRPRQQSRMAVLEKALRDAMPGWFSIWTERSTATLQAAIAQAEAAFPPEGSSLQAALLEAKAMLRSKEEAQAKKEAEERAQREAEERAQREAEERAQREAEERARREAEERARREAAGGGVAGTIEYVGLWRDEAARTFPRMPKPLPGCEAEEGGKFYWSRDVAASVQQLAARIAAEGHSVGYLGLQYPCGDGFTIVAVFESVGPAKPWMRLGAGAEQGRATSVQVAGFAGKIVEQGGGWTNAVYKITVNGGGGGGGGGTGTIGVAGTIDPPGASATAEAPVVHARMQSLRDSCGCNNRNKTGWGEDPHNFQFGKEGLVSCCWGVLDLQYTFEQPMQLLGVANDGSERNRFSIFSSVDDASGWVEQTRGYKCGGHVSFGAAGTPAPFVARRVRLVWDSLPDQSRFHCEMRGRPWTKVVSQ